MGIRAATNLIGDQGFRQPILVLLTLTFALNILGLTIPVAAAQIFGRIVPNPSSATLPILVIGVCILAALEALLRFGRAMVVARAGANFAGVVTQRLLSHILISEPADRRLASSRSVEYLSAVQKLKEKYNGQLVVSIGELFFLPIIISVILFISWTAGACVIVCVAIFALRNIREARRMKAIVARNIVDSEERYDFLFAMLSAMHGIKAMGIEDNILRRYEAAQEKIAANNHELAIVTGRLLNSTPIASQVLIAAMLTFGAIAVGQGHLTMGGVSALVLLSSRVMGPLQRAIFILVQMRDIDEAETKVEALFAQPAISTPTDDLKVVNEGRVSADNLACWPVTGSPLFENVHFALQPGVTAALSGTSEQAKSAFLQIIAGIHNPATGEVLLNGVAPTKYPRALLNRCVGYVSSAGVLFRGTIRDNITRFGEVSVDEAMDVAHVLEIDSLINALPNGLDTEVLGSASDTIPPGLRQQLAILRALATRPRLILLDNADRGLDRDGYAKLNRFIGKIHGQASFIIVSDDANLLSYASKRLVLERDGIRPLEGFQVTERKSYRDLKI